MNVPIWLEQRDGVFIASSVADPEVRAEGLTRAAALRDIRRRLLDQAGGRELVFVSLDDTPVDDIFGSMAGDPDLQNICDEAYRLRDQQFREEFPDDDGTDYMHSVTDDEERKWAS